MNTQVFHMLSEWRVRGSVEDVYDILSQPEGFVRWWPSVYLEVREIAPGNAEGIGRVVALKTKGRLPYRLYWQAESVSRERPSHMAVRATGDLDGEGVWHFRQAAEWVDIQYNWTVHINKRWMRVLSPILKPVFEANHRWAMRQGEAGLQTELFRLDQTRTAGAS